VIAASLAITIAALSRRYFEEPFLRLKDRMPQHLPRLSRKDGQLDLITSPEAEHGSRTP